MTVWRFDGIGTTWEVETPDPLTAEIRERITALIERYDAAWSRFRADSLVTRIATARDGGVFDCPAEAPALFALYDLLHEATDGAVDPLVGRQLEWLGYDAAYSLVPIAAQDMPPRQSWPRNLGHHGKRVVTIEPVLIDVGAAGKGQLVDLVADLLMECGVHSFVVDASGDMRQAGAMPLEVGLEHPHDPTRVIGVVALQGRALCASASNRRAWGEGLHHIVDARTGVPATSIVATRVIAPNAMTADGVATALFFTEPQRLQAFGSFAWARMTDCGSLEASSDFPGELFA
jgi:thiamine biosynthesis lipoprotein